jgi:putative Holliday junction resolvase
MRILGVDYGERRTGLAISDPLGISAQPLPTIESSSDNELVEGISALAVEKGVEEIVVGLPRNMDGTIGKAGDRVMKFVEMLREKLNCPIAFEDERLTTMMADRTLAALGEKPRKRKKKLDRMAAQLILQNYLARRNGSPGEHDT